jgi:hypothetical protein
MLWICVNPYCSGAAKQKSHQKVMIFDFGAKYLNQNSISTKMDSICCEELDAYFSFGTNF